MITLITLGDDDDESNVFITPLKPSLNNPNNPHNPNNPDSSLIFTPSSQRDHPSNPSNPNSPNNPNNPPTATSGGVTSGGATGGGNSMNKPIFFSFQKHRTKGALLAVCWERVQLTFVSIYIYTYIYIYVYCESKIITFYNVLYGGLTPSLPDNHPRGIHIHSYNKSGFIFYILNPCMIITYFQVPFVFNQARTVPFSWGVGQHIHIKDQYFGGKNSGLKNSNVKRIISSNGIF